MRIIGTLGLAVVLLLGGCTSTGFLGLATTSYVSGRIEEARREEAREMDRVLAELQQPLAELERLQKDMNEYRKLADQVNQLVQKIALAEQNAGQNAERIRQLAQRADQADQNAEGLKALAQRLDQIEQGTEKLRVLASQLAVRQDILPREALEELVGIFQSYLKRTAALGY